MLGEEHQRTLLLMTTLSQVLRARGDYAAAEPLLVQCVEVRHRVFGEEHWHTAEVMGNLAVLYWDQGKYDQAEALLVKRVEIIRRVRGPEHPDLAWALAWLGSVRLQQQRFAEAEPVLREALAIGEAKVPDDWHTPNTRWLLGGALLGQKKYAEAEPLLIQGYEGLVQHRDKIPPQRRNRPNEALERLVQLYDAWGKKDKADEWRKKLEEAKAPPKAAAQP